MPKKSIIILHPTLASAYPEIIASGERIDANGNPISWSLMSCFEGRSVGSAIVAGEISLASLATLLTPMLETVAGALDLTGLSNADGESALDRIYINRIWPRLRSLGLTTPEFDAFVVSRSPELFASEPVGDHPSFSSPAGTVTLDATSTVNVNGTSYANPAQVFQTILMTPELRALVLPRTEADPLHGDMTESNMMIMTSTNKVTLIDYSGTRYWDGLHFRKTDPVLDLAKLIFGVAHGFTLCDAATVVGHSEPGKIHLGISVQQDGGVISDHTLRQATDALTETILQLPALRPLATLEPFLSIRLAFGVASQRLANIAIRHHKGRTDLMGYDFGRAAVEFEELWQLISAQQQSRAAA